MSRNDNNIMGPVVGEALGSAADPTGPVKKMSYEITPVIGFIS